MVMVRTLITSMRTSAHSCENTMRNSFPTTRFLRDFFKTNMGTYWFANKYNQQIHHLFFLFQQQQAFNRRNNKQVQIMKMLMSYLDSGYISYYFVSEIHFCF